MGEHTCPPGSVPPVSPHKCHVKGGSRDIYGAGEGDASLGIAPLHPGAIMEIKNFMRVVPHPQAP